MPEYSLRELDVLAFVAIPVILIVCLALGISAASRQLGYHDAARARAVAVLIGGAVWMAAS